MRVQGFRWLAIRNAHLLLVGALHNVSEHRDPFDRLLVCQSRAEPMLLLSSDRQLERDGSPQGNPCVANARCRFRTSDILLVRQALYH